LDNVVSIDPGISAFRVILDSDIVISMPFTSTAFIANYYRKKSFFYDPSKSLFEDDRGAQGVELISGYDELYDIISIL
jgi:polysaccharide biosynthesis PFTS motif protein